MLKKNHWHRCFPVNCAKFTRTAFVQKTSGRLLLNSANLTQFKRSSSFSSIFGSIWNTRSKNYKMTWEGNYNFPRFLILRFCPIPKILNLKISKNFVLIQFLVVYEIQDIKFKKITKDKKKLLLYNVVWNEKMSVFEVSRFSILSCTWISKTWKSGKVFVYFKFFIPLIALSVWKLKSFIKFNRPHVY